MQPSPPSDPAPTTWADQAEAFVSESYISFLSVAGVVISVAIVAAAARAIVSLVRRAGREAG